MSGDKKARLVLPEMPKQCICCPCYSDNIEECRATDKNVTIHDAIYVANRPEWCPLEYINQNDGTIVENINSMSPDARGMKIGTIADLHIQEQWEIFHGKLMDAFNKED